MRHLLIGSVVAAAMAFGRAGATDYWVDPQGRGGPCDDRGPGLTLDAPLCSVQACVALGLQPGDRCILREGRYDTLPPPEANLHDDVLAKGCSVPTDGTLLVSVYSLAGRTLNDGETPAGPWEFCCVAK